MKIYFIIFISCILLILLYPYILIYLNKSKYDACKIINNLNNFSILEEHDPTIYHPTYMNNWLSIQQMIIKKDLLKMKLIYYLIKLVFLLCKFGVQTK
jgi:hypothetical protein